MKIEPVLKRLGVELTPESRFRCPCPDHPDENPSADFRGGDGSRWVCRSCDKGGDAVDLVSLHRSIGKAEAARWLLGEPGRVNGKANGRSFGSLAEAAEALKRGREDWKAITYAYGDRHSVIRLEGEGEKDFRPFHLGADGRWHMAKGTDSWPLYGSPNDPCDVLVIVEGEKAADSINASWGRFRAITSQGGSSGAKGSNWGTLPPANRIILWPDNDEPGRKYVAEVAELLEKAGRWPRDGVAVVELADREKAWDAFDELKGLDPDKAAERLESILASSTKRYRNPKDLKRSTLPKLAELGLTVAAGIEPRSTDYLVPGVMARGELSLICGEAGSGKTKVCMARAAALTRGEDLCGKPIRGGSQKVAIISFEECPERTIRPVCELSGMDLTKAMFWTPPETSGAKDIRSIERLCELLEVLGREGFGYVLIDSLSALYGRLGLDINDTKAPYEVHGAINRVARAENLCVEMIHHYSKGAAQTHSDHKKSAGSYAVTGSVRSVLRVEHDPETGTRFLGVAPDKNNLGLRTECLGFRTRRVAEDRNDGQGWIVAELGGWNVEETIDDVTARITRAKNESARAKVRPVSMAASETIEAFLGNASGVAATVDIDSHLTKAGYTPNAVEIAKKGFEKLAFRVDGRLKWFLTNLEPDKARAVLIDRFPQVAPEAPEES